jgi:hypothetical protein
VSLPVRHVTSVPCDAGTAAAGVSKIAGMRLVITAAALALYALPALAERDPQSGAPLPPKKHQIASPITDHFSARASYFSPQLRTTLRADPVNAPPGTSGTTLNAEQDLGLPDKLHKGRVEFMFRLRERHKVRFDYLEADRSGSQVLANDIIFKDVTFLGGLPATSSLDWKQFNITYTYSFLRNQHFELGTGFAAYFLQLDAQITQPQPFAIALHEEVSGASPFPALPLDFVWVISQRWSATAHGAYLRATVDGTHGWFADLHEDVQYRWNPNFVIGLGYSSTRTSLTKEGGTSFPGYFNMSISGFEAFLRLSF